MARHFFFSACMVAFLAVSLSGYSADITVTGDMEVSKTTSLKTSGKGITFPDGTRQTSAPLVYAETLFISPRGTTAENGIALLDAMGAITDATGSKRYLIRLEGGVYNLAVESLSLKPFVDIEGAGQEATFITGNKDSNSSGVINGASYCELRNLTIEHTGGGEFAIAFYNSSTYPRLTRVTIKASNANSAYAMHNTSGYPTIDQATFLASGTAQFNCAVYNAGSALPTLKNTAARASGATINFAIWNTDHSHAVLQNVTAEASGGEDCHGILNDESNPKMFFITSSAHGGSVGNNGIENVSSSPTMAGVTASASGGQYNYGVYNSESSSPLMIDVSATATGGSEAHGIYNHSSAPAITNVYAEGTGASLNASGMTNYAESSAYAVSVDRSTFKGGTASVSNHANFTLTIGLSKLDGPASLAGTYHCFACFNGSYAALDADCQPIAP